MAAIALNGRIVECIGAWQIATVPGVHGFTSWAKMGPITGNDPVDEPGSHVWFEFGKTRQEAKEKILRELGLQLGN